MRSVDALLAELHSLGVTLEANGDRLRIRAPRETMSASLTREIRERKPEVLARLSRADQPALERLADAPHFELSHGQRRIWVLSQLDEGSAAYNVPLHQRLEGPLDMQALARALDQLGSRHESLRTTFEVRDGEPRQVVHTEPRLTLEHINLSANPAPEAAAAELGRRHACEPLDLEHGPLLRTALISLGHNRHLLLITAHHIVTDGFSNDVLAHDLSRLYEAARRNEAPDLPPLRVQYRDYAHWQNERLRRGALDAERAYWHRVLAGPLPVLDLPADRPRPRVQTFAGHELSFTIPEPVLSRLIALGRRSRASLFMVLLALLDALLHRYTGQTDILVGTPVAGREHPDLETQVGFYLNMLALRTRVDGREPFEALLARVRRTATEAYDHQQYPFDRLVDELGLARDLSRGALFDVVVIMQSQPDRGFDFEQLQARADFAHPGTSKFDLTWCFKRVREGLTLSVEYNTDLFATERIRRMGTHYLELARGVADAPETPVNRLPMLTCEERNGILRGLARAQAFEHPPGTVVDLLVRQVARTPDAVAAEGPGGLGDQWETLTYAGLDARANQLANALRAMGVGAGTRVAIGLERSLDMLIAVLGVLKSGAAYVPLDPAFPAARLALTMEDSGVEVLVTGDNQGHPLADGRTRLLDMERDRGHIAAFPEISPSTRPDPACPAYVIYTSGSTGRPKGVVISHRALLDFLLSIRRRTQLGHEQVVLAVTTLAFDISVLELLGPLVTGGRIVLADGETAADGSRLSDALGQRGVNMMQATPATWRMLLDSGWPGDPQLVALCGGEALDRGLALTLAARVATLWNLYGPTETTVWSAASQVREPDLAASPHGAAVSVGRPLDDTEIYVIDGQLQPVPVGVPGELLIGGVGLADGYHGRPALTAAAFVPHPFSDTPGARLYRTGDLARWRGDGTLEFLGRTDQQLKIRGFRVEPGEIESCLDHHAGVCTSVVKAHFDSAGVGKLVAYVVPEPGHGISHASLRAHVAERLPAYLVPSWFVFLDELPLTPNGKVDRRALSPPGAAGADPAPPANAYAAPRDGLEATVTRLWQDVLEVDRVGVHDDFFELGGHSLSATRLASLLERETGARVRLRDLFDAPTPAALATVLRARLDDAGPALGSDTLTAPQQPIAPATPKELEMLDDY